MRFEQAIERALGHEAGYVNDPNDPGGETKWGISKRTYPHLNIKELTRDQAIELYRTDFWDKIHADLLPNTFDYQILDAAVNSGIPRSIQFLQWALEVADDGDWGPVTACAAIRLNDDKLFEARVLFRFAGQRLDFMTRRRNWPDHGKGWSRRIARNLYFAAEDL